MSPVMYSESEYMYGMLSNNETLSEFSHLNYVKEIGDETLCNEKLAVILISS